MLTIRAIVAIGVIGSLGACASVTQDKTQSLKVETLDQTGNKIVGAKCELQNDRGAYKVETPDTVFVRKSAGDMSISCTADEQEQADGRLISRTGGAVFGNILLGGVVGAVVDTASGVAYNYPDWVQLVFGKTLTFDRRDHKDAQPNIAMADDEQVGETIAAVETTEPKTQDTQSPKVEHITIVASPAETQGAAVPTE